MLFASLRKQKDTDDPTLDACVRGKLRNDSKW